MKTPKLDYFFCLSSFLCPTQPGSEVCVYPATYGRAPGSTEAPDFHIPQLLTHSLAPFRTVCYKPNLSTLSMRHK